MYVPGLQCLTLANCQTTVPEDVTLLSDLTTLDVSRTSIGFPTLCSLTSLTALKIINVVRCLCASLAGVVAGPPCV